MKNYKPSITFHKDIARNILGAFGKSLDSENYLIDKRTHERVLSPKGEEINIKEFGGIVNGSEIYLKSDIASLIEFVEAQ